MELGAEHGMKSGVREKDRDRLAIKGLCLHVCVACECVKKASMGVLSQRGNKDVIFFTIQRNIVTETLNFYPPKRQPCRDPALSCVGGSTPIHAII